MRPWLAALVVVSACRRPAERPAEAMREKEYVQLEAASSAEPATVLGAWMTPDVAGVWRTDAARMPKMAAASPRVRADAYADSGWISVSFAGLAPEIGAWLDGELGALLEAIASREDVAGASVVLRNDADGSTVSVRAVAGRDAAEAAMALVDAWAPELELGYAPGQDRDALVAALRKSDALGRRLGGTLEKRASCVVVRWPSERSTREIAASLAEGDLRAAFLASGTAGRIAGP